MKNLLLIILLPLSFLFFKNDNFASTSTHQNYQKSTPCRVKNIYYNDTLIHEYFYDNDDRIKRIDFIWPDEIITIFSLEYDQLNRISNSYYFYPEYKSQFIEEGQKYSVHRKSKNSYEYQNGQIDNIIFYYGAVYDRNITDKDLKKTKSNLQLIYDSENRIVKIQRKSKKRKKKKKRSRSWTELEYDLNKNPIKIEQFYINESQDTLIISRVEREYDSQPKVQFSYMDFLTYPGVVNNNNIIYEKKVSFEKKPKVNYEYKYTHDYDENGLILKTTREIIHKWPENKNGKIDIYTYEYECD